MQMSRALLRKSLMKHFPRTSKYLPNIVSNENFAYLSELIHIIAKNIKIMIFYIHVR